MIWHVRIVCTLGPKLDAKAVAAKLRRGVRPGVSQEWIGKQQDGAPVVSTRKGDVVLALRISPSYSPDALSAAMWGAERAYSRFASSHIARPVGVNVSVRLR